jgi:murein DD-endopeptidase MepM/ murein hydrolase activator NlpD
MNLLGHLSLAAASAAEAAKRHPRKITAAVVALLAGFGATAFGVAPGMPDASDLPQRLITEDVTPDDLHSQLEALADYELQLSRADLTRASDTADSLLERLGVHDPAAAAFLRKDATARHLLEGRGGKMVQVRADSDGQLTELIARYAADGDQAATHFQRLTIARQPDGALSAKVELAKLESQVKLASGTIRSSLFTATDDARIPDAIATQLAEMFATDIDFHHGLRKGDTFSLVYDTLTADGEPITWGGSVGHIQAAQFVNNGKTYQSLWYRDANGKGAYFDFNGQSKRRAFLASPMEFSRVTSGFAMRFHPILGEWKRHLGVDYGAPTGTPVRVVGDGTVKFAGQQNGYGNVVIVQHSGDRETVYAHLSRILVRAGQHVGQGDHIGNVGMTGWATGPHLHFEFRVHGQHQDPLAIARAAESQTVQPASAQQFQALALAAKAELAAASSLVGARASAD